MNYYRNSISILFLLLPAVVWADLPTPTGDTIVDPGAKLELLHKRNSGLEGGLTEGPAASPDGTIYFTDIPPGKQHGMILRFDPDTDNTTLFTNRSSKANGLAFDAAGHLVACEGADYGGRAVVRWDLKTGKRTVLASQYQTKRFNAPNDLCLDRAGNIYFTDPKYTGHEPRELAHRAVYRIDPDGKVIEVTHNVSKPNGIALSPDGKTLYVADHDNGSDNIGKDDKLPKLGPMKIYAFALNTNGKTQGPRRTLVDFGEEAGCDGMTVDAQGNIYLTARQLSRPGVLVIDPTGNEVAFIPTGQPNQAGNDPTNPPVGIPSNVEFGVGEESNMLYITVDTSLYRIRLKANGYHLP